MSNPKCPRCKQEMEPFGPGEYPSGVTAPDGYQEIFTTRGGSQCLNCGLVLEDEGLPEECCVLECEEPRAPDDCYCPHHALVADDMKRLYDGAAKAGWFEGDRP